MLVSDKSYKDEATLLAKVVEWLEPQRRDGIKVLRVIDRYHKGYSDLFISARGRFVVVELKDNTGTATPHQELFIKEMIESGATGGVCRSIKDVVELLEKAIYCQCTYLSASTKFCQKCGKETKK